MLVNGAEAELGCIKNLKDYLEREGYLLDRVAVEKNGRIVPKALYAAETLDDGDRLEIVAFVGGG
jgi:sulfur carrier protein